MNTINDLSIGKKIELLRRALNLNQTQFADKIGTHLLTVHKIEAGKKIPSVDELETISNKCGLAVDSIELVYKPCGK